MTPPINDNVIDLKELSVGYTKGSRNIFILKNLTISLRKAQLTCLVGKNGVGKSTLLRTIAGVQAALEGNVMINHAPISQLSANELAATVSVVLTDRIFAGSLTIEELVALGRFPYTNWLGTLTDKDQRKIDEALVLTGIDHLRSCSIHELSDGQFQKSLIARALAQDGDIMILDEPTAHLDLVNKISILKLLKELTRKTHKSVLIATHDLEFSLSIADQLWIARGTDEFHAGCPEDLVLNGQFKFLIDHDAVDFNMDNGRFSIANVPDHFCRVTGKGALLYWTLNALQRNGWGIQPDLATVEIIVGEDDGMNSWLIRKGETELKCDTVESLIEQLNNFME